VSADCTLHLNEQDCFIHGCEYDGHCHFPSSEDALARSNKLLRKQHEALVKALHAITEGTMAEKDVAAMPREHTHGGPRAARGTMAEKDVAAMIREHTHGGSGRYGRPRAARETAVGPRRYYQDGDRFKETAVGPRRHHRDGQEKAVGAEACDEYCESWEEFKESKADDKSQEEICGMYKSTRCSTCADVQAYCGWKKVTEDEVYTYSVTPGGKCMTLDGADPKYLYEGGKGSECEQLCDGMIDCFGYSISGYDNCLLWLQRDIMGGGDEWGDADCHIKDVSCSGNVGEDYNCGECYNGFSKKYLWGNACQAKNLGADTYTKGVCGEEYKCFTNNEDIGECPYGEYCPSV